MEGCEKRDGEGVRRGGDFPHCHSIIRDVMMMEIRAKGHEFLFSLAIGIDRKRETESD